MPYNGVFGITRFDIGRATNGRGGYRFENSAACWEMADALYRRIFAAGGMPLAERERVVTSVATGSVGTAELYDRHLGIDVVLRLANGRALTLQEKFLTTTFNTVTVEYMNDAARGVPGDWFSMKTQLYFVGYVDQATMTWRRWLLLNWPAVVIQTERGALVWEERVNQNDAARASFRYAPMASFPASCVVASSERPTPASRANRVTPSTEAAALRDYGQFNG